MSDTIQDRRNKIKAILAICAFIASIVFGMMGLLLPPSGYINPTVLIWLAQLLVFSAMLLGFSASENQLLKEITDVLKDLKTTNG